VFQKEIQTVWCAFLRDFGAIISNQITLCFLKGLAIKVGGLSDAVAFMTLPLSHVNMDDYDLKNHDNMGLY
jgi:hypothetical protein